MRSPLRAAALALLAGLLAPFAATAAATAEGADLRLGDAVLPTFEAIRLRVDPAGKEYSGTVAVDLTAHRATDGFRLHARGQTLGRFVLTRDGREVPLRYEPGEPGKPDAGGLVQVRTAEPLAPGAYHLEIEFTQAFNTRSVGLYRTEKEGQSYAFTQLEADDARRAFPCWDEPGVKIPYQLTVVIPAADQAVSNTPIEKESPAGDGKTVVFARTPPLPAYLLALAVGRFEFTPIPGLSVPGRIVTVPGQGRLAGAAIQAVPPLLAVLERWFGRSYPYAKLDLIATPEFWPGGMENPGAILFADQVLLLDPASAADQRARQARVLAHELAHMWFGDLVTMRWWDDLWLSESFADWIADKATDEAFPAWQSGNGALGEINAVMAFDARPSAIAVRRPVVDPDSLLENVGVAYGKGKGVLSMFEAWIGPETFRRGVNDYLQEHAFGNATADDLWRALGRAAGKDVGAAMATFLDQPGLPLVGVEILPGGRITLSQERLTDAGSPPAPLTWKVPVGLKYGDGTTVRTTTVLLAGPRQTVALPGVSSLTWVMPDLGGVGYYRWSLPEAQLVALAQDASGRFVPRERAALLADLSALFRIGRVHGDTYFKVATAYAADPEPFVVSSLIARLDAVRPALVPEARAESFAAYVRRTFRPVLDRIGREARPGEGPNVPALRARLLGWLGDEGRDEEILHYAGTLARRYLADPAGFDPVLAQVALDLAALHGDRALYDEVRRRFENARTPTERNIYLRSLGHFRDPALREETLGYFLNGRLQPGDILRQALGMGDTEAGADRVFAWMHDHYDQIAARI
ncbi:MAG TPA: M1 family metallopeptidase, partial [Thermoanaerobaculia bacterium]|nr:M1 family metallopeptidase [Thermoanaerobaculia bacterium]